MTSVTRALSLALAAALAGCWHDPPPPAIDPPPPETATMRPLHRAITRCERAIDHALSVTRDDLDPPIAENFARARDEFVRSCRDMQWSAELLQCLDDLSPTSGLDRCRDLMSPEQLADIGRVFSELGVQ